MDTVAPRDSVTASAVDAARWALSVVVPACNATTTIESTLVSLTNLPGGPPLEIIVVENGSTDETWELLQRVQQDWDPDIHLVTLRSERGIGAAYRAGMARCTGTWVLLTADDLPFGTSDVHSVLACPTPPLFAIGSKAHPRSRVPRSLPRRVASRGFRLARRCVIGLDIGDTQGTFVIEAGLARELVGATTIAGFGMTTELVALAVRRGVHPVELPVVLTDQTTPSRIRWISDSLQMMTSLLRLRRLHRVGGEGRTPGQALAVSAHPGEEQNRSETRPQPGPGMSPLRDRRPDPRRQ